MYQENQGRHSVKLTEEVLVLHPGILKAFMLQERGGKLVVVEEAAKPGDGGLAYEIDESLESGALTPLLILGAAVEFNKNSNPLRLVGFLYGNGGVMFTYVSEDRLLAICTEASRFPEAMQTVNGALPGLIRELEVTLKPAGHVKSAVEAEQITRTYVARATKSSQVFVDEINLNQTRSMWEIHGSHRSSTLTRSRKFQLQLDAETGAVMAFASTPKPSLAPIYAGIGVVIGTLLFLVWLISTLVRG
jgi:stage V sporulation protein SpoVS